MSQKEIGYVEMQWTCPNCAGINPGTARVCQNCGAAQPKDVQFEQAAAAKARQDEELKKTVQAGADIHCPYCGTRNPASAKICSQCGGDISTGSRRETGRVVGSYKEGPGLAVSCPRCSTANPPGAVKCQNCGAPLSTAAPTAAPPSAAPQARKFPVWLIVVLAVVCVAFGALMFMLTRTESQVGAVEQAEWQLLIPIEALVPVDYSAWRDEVPPQADLGSCAPKLREVSPVEAAGAVEVCGTPYTVDTGTGVGKVVQDCQYEIYADFCNYTVEEWQVVDQAVSSGGVQDQLAWPQPLLQAGQRIGEDSQEMYTIVFIVDGKAYTFQTADYALFQQAEPGSEWTLEINGLGQVVRAEP